MTTYKSLNIKTKIPHYSNPVNYQLIVEGLGDIEEINEIQIARYNEGGGAVGAFDRGTYFKKLKGDTSDLMSFQCMLSIRDVVPCQFYTHEYSISSYGCRSGDAVFVKQFVQNTGIPIIKNWLESPKTETWYLGRRNFLVGLNLEKYTYCILEVHNDRVVHKAIESLISLQ